MLTIGFSQCSRGGDSDLAKERKMQKFSSKANLSISLQIEQMGDFRDSLLQDREASHEVVLILSPLMWTLYSYEHTIPMSFATSHLT